MANARTKKEDSSRKEYLLNDAEVRNELLKIDVVCPHKFYMMCSRSSFLFAHVDTYHSISLAISLSLSSAMYIIITTMVVLTTLMMIATKIVTTVTVDI